MPFNTLIDLVGELIWSGWIALLDYLAAHVLLCLVPAFIIAGFLSAMIPQGIIVRFLGPKAPRWISYPSAAIGGFILAVCSCTILPLFAGIWKRGAGLGAATTFLFVGPAVNILAIAYTGAAIGMDIAVARIILSIFFGISIGMIMAWLFRDEEARHTLSDDASQMFDRQTTVQPAVWAVFIMLVAVLLVGTLQIDLLTAEWVTVKIPIEVPAILLTTLDQLNLQLQGALLILMLIFLAPIAHLGLEHVLEHINRWTYLSIVLTALTLLLAAPAVTEGSLVVGITGRFVGELILIVSIAVVAARNFDHHEITSWLWETWKFVKQIFPLLIGGVFIAGVIKGVLPSIWVQTIAGRNTIWANLAGVLFGVFLYFPTLVEVPIARMFLDLGMHRGPLLAYLLADPALSIQSILVTEKILGARKTTAYVVLVTIFSTMAGILFGLLIAGI